MKYSLISRKQMILYAVTLIADQFLVVVCYNTVLALILKDATNAVLTRNAGLLIRACLLAAVTFVIVFTIGPVISRANRYAVKTVLNRIRVQAYSRALHAKVPEIEKLGTADLMTRLTTDIDMLETLLTGYIPAFVFAILIGVIAVVMMFIENIWLALCAVIIGIASVLVSNRLSRPVTTYSEQYQQSVSVMTKQLLDAEQGKTDIKMNQCEHFMLKRFGHVNHSLSDLFFRRENCMKRLSTASELFSNLNQIVLIALGLWLFSKGQVSIGGVLAVLQLSGNASYLFQNFSSFLGGIKKYLPSIKRTEQIFEIGQEDRAQGITCAVKADNLEAGKDRIAGEDGMSGKDRIAGEVVTGETANHEDVILALDNVSFAYPKADTKKILNGVSMTVCTGEFVSLEGESGCGKSTLLKILLGFYEIDHGRMYLNGYDRAKTDIQTWRKNISYVPQDCYLYELSVRENLMLAAPDITEEEMYDACKAVNAHEFILNMEHGYDTVLTAHAQNLSGGQRQRIAIARALLSKAPLLLLDEATSALDPDIEEQIKQMLNQYKRKKAILCIAHRKALIEDADVRLWMNQGVIYTQ